MTESLAPPVTEDREHHPTGLWILFFSELWERFSFYGMRALLVLYMTSNILRYGADAAYGVYAAYGALVYASPIIGGYFADKVMGTRRAIILGGVLMALGHFCMAIVDERQIFFYSALGLICVGNGFFKPNISTTVGRLYAPQDTMRDRGFVIFYMGINIGAFLAPLLCGWLGQTFGWHYGFGAAGIGMVIGLIVFVRGQRHLEGHGEAVDPAVARKWNLPLWGFAFALAFLLGFAIHHHEYVSWVLLAVYFIVMAWIIRMAVVAETTVERHRIFLFLILALFHMVFWALFEQAGSSLTLYANFCVDKYGLKTSMWQAWNPLFIVLLGPVFNFLWGFLDRRGKNPSIPRKFGIALMWLGLGFYVLVPGAASVTPPEVFVPGLFLILLYFLHTTGELCLSPVGLSAVTKLAPVASGAFFMGAWFLTISAGHHTAGAIAKLTGDVDEYKIEARLDNDLVAAVEEASESDDELTREELVGLEARARDRLQELGIDPEPAFAEVDLSKVPTDAPEDETEEAIAEQKAALVEALNQAIPIRFFVREGGEIDLEGLLAFDETINETSAGLGVDVEPKHRIPLDAETGPVPELVRTSASRMETKIQLIVPRLEPDGDYDERLIRLITEGVEETYEDLELDPSAAEEPESGLIGRIRTLQGKMLEAFTGVYEMGGIAAIVLGVLLFMFAPLINRLGHGVK